MKNKFLIIDMISEIGHIPFNTWYLKQEIFKNSIFFVSKTLVNAYPDFKIKKIESFNNNYSPLKRFFFSFRLLNKILFQKNRRVIFLSYDLKYFILVALSLKIFNKKIYTIEHNTIPNTYLKKIIHYILSFIVTKIVFTDYIKSIYPNNKKVTVINHPITIKNCNKISPSKTMNKLKILNYDKIIFCPSFSSKFLKIKEAALNNPKYLFVTKKTNYDMPNNIIQAGFIEDYFEFLFHCDAVYVPFNHQYRVSNVIFESIGLNKLILTENSKFYNFLTDMKFDVFLISELNNELFRKKIQNNTFDYNNSISDELNQLFSS